MTLEKHMCKAGLHDLSQPCNVYVRKNGKRCCLECKRQHSRETYDRRRKAGLISNRAERAMTEAEAEAFLANQVRLEVAFPWVRHPEPWDHVGQGGR